jgi:RNA polymerase sigma factor (sigma-70 family)
MIRRHDGGEFLTDDAARIYPGLPEDEAVALVHRYQDGDAAALAALHGQLRPAIRAALRRLQVVDLPPTLTSQDLEQQSWIVLADLALHWQPDGRFLAYFFQSFAHQMSRFVQQAASTRRTRLIEVVTLPHDDLVLKLEGIVDQDLGAGELSGGALPLLDDLAALPRRQRAAFLLHAVDGHDFEAIGRTLQISRASAHRLYHQARQRLQGPGLPISTSGEASEPRDSASIHETPQRQLERWVRGLHNLAGQDGVLAGRRRVAVVLGLSRREYTALLIRLEAAGAIVERAPTRSGRLVDASPQATLERVRSTEEGQTPPTPARP